jgi:integrase
MSASFEQFVLSWLATVAIVKYKTSGYAEYEGVCRNHLVPALGDVPIESVTASRIQDYIADKVASGLSPRTVINHVQVLRRVMDYALTCGLVTSNPVSKVSLPRQERTEMRFLTPEQLHRLIEATPRSWSLLTAMAALTGLRKSTQLALMFSDIDFEKPTISVTKAIRNGVVMTPKTEVTGVVPLPESLIPLLQERRTKVSDPDGLIFCRADGSPLPDGLPNRILAKALSSAGLPRIRWHDLRHSWVVGHLKAGTDVPTLQRLGLWKSADTLLSVYAHVLPATGGDAVRKLDELVSQTQ